MRQPRWWSTSNCAWGAFRCGSLNTVQPFYKGASRPVRVRTCLCSEERALACRNECVVKAHLEKARRDTELEGLAIARSKRPNVLEVVRCAEEVLNLARLESSSLSGPELALTRARTATSSSSARARRAWRLHIIIQPWSRAI
jgi:hypothetical protein